MHSLSPVIVFAYIRSAHLARTLSALALNKEADETNLIIYCDHVPENASADAIEQMQLTRMIAHREIRFKSVKVIERTTNFGLAENVMQGVSEVVKEYGRVIVLEDDLLVASDFLRFMNEALKRYEGSENVACISGYVYPLAQEPSTSFFIRGADCWGWATWEDKWSILERDAAVLIDQIEKKRLVRVLDFDESYPYMNMLRDRHAGRNNSWAVLWYASAFIQNKLCLYPSRSLVQNIGNDGSGTNHVVWTNAYNVSLQSVTDFRWPKIAEESIEGRELFTQFFNGMKPSFASKFRNILGGLIRRIKGRSGNNVWSGNYASWNDAQKECTGYDSNSILQQVQMSIRKVVNGEAAYERDGVAFTEFDYSADMRSALEDVYRSNGSPISILDFGGSLGSLYFQYRSLLNGKIASWNVIEQKHFVESGKSEFENDVLKFYFSIEELLAIKRPDLIILSSVLCYLEDPYLWIEKFLALGIKHVIVDRTAFIQGKSDRLCIQQVPDSIYSATYPAWFLNEEKFLKTWITDYDIGRELHDSIDGTNSVNGLTCYRNGYYFVRRK